MSWLATKYAWNCRHDAVKGSVRLVLLAIALRVKKNYISTLPTSLKTLERLTLLSDDALRRCLNTLEVAGEVRRVRRGKWAVYAMAKMAGPLFVETPQDAAFFDHEKSPQDAVFSSRKMRGNSAVCARGVLSSEGTCTRVPTTPEEQAAAGFLDWFFATYHTKRGYPYRVKRETAERVIGELLKDRSVERLQTMALLMFDAVHDDFIVKSDYSVFVLQHKASYLEGLVVANE